MILFYFILNFTFNFFIILAQTKPEELLHSLRSVHSPKHCQLLRINSRRPDPLATVNEVINL